MSGDRVAGHGLEALRSRARPARLTEALHNLLVLVAGLRQLGELLEAAPGLVQGRRAPFRVSVENVHFQKLGHSVLVTALRSLDLRYPEVTQQQREALKEARRKLEAE